MPKTNNILIIIQRSNGDVFLANPLITVLYKHYNNPNIDLLINDDTLAVAKTLQYIDNIITFSYKKKQEIGFKQDIAIIKKIYKKYDLAINLTTSDRSVLYAILATKISISVVDEENKKSWWKKLLLHKYYLLKEQHTIKNNIATLKLLNITNNKIISNANYDIKDLESINKKLAKLKIKKFIIFHPSAQYNYKIYPRHLRDELLTMLNNLGIAIIITGGRTKIDLTIKSTLPNLSNIYDFIAETSLGELIALSSLSDAYIGMDTLNMHIAVAQNKHIFVIFGPTNTKTWSPWSNNLQQCADAVVANNGIKTYDNINIFQASMPCVPCNQKGCDNSGKSECLYNITPKTIFNTIKSALKNKYP